MSSYIAAATSSTPSWANHGGFTKGNDKFADRCPIASTASSGLCTNAQPQNTGYYPVQVSTRILGKRTAPPLTFSYSCPRPAWFYPKILILTPRPS